MTVMKENRSNFYFYYSHAWFEKQVVLKSPSNALITQTSPQDIGYSINFLGLMFGLVIAVVKADVLVRL